MSNLNVLLLKGLLLLLTAPAWYPFLKAVWEELNEAMADEGGLFGRPPTAKELTEIERQRVDRGDPLVHEPWPTAQERQAGRRGMGTRPTQAGTGPGPRPSARPAARKGGFR